MIDIITKEQIEEDYISILDSLLISIKHLKIDTESFRKIAGHLTAIFTRLFKLNHSRFYTSISLQNVWKLLNMSFIIIDDLTKPEIKITIRSYIWYIFDDMIELFTESELYEMSANYNNFRDLWWLQINKR